MLSYNIGTIVLFPSFPRTSFISPIFGVDDIHPSVTPTIDFLLVDRGLFSPVPPLAKTLTMELILNFAAYNFAVE